MKDFTIKIYADTSEVDIAMDRIHARLKELRAEAEEIGKMTPGAKAEVDELIASLERIVRAEK